MGEVGERAWSGGLKGEGGEVKEVEELVGEVVVETRVELPVQ